MTFADGLKITDVTTANTTGTAIIFTTPAGSVSRIQLRGWSVSNNISTITLDGRSVFTSSGTGSVGFGWMTFAQVSPSDRVGSLEFIYMDENEVISMTGNGTFSFYIETFNKP